jgi:hypothetical protein
MTVSGFDAGSGLEESQQEDVSQKELTEHLVPAQTVGVPGTRTDESASGVSGEQSGGRTVSATSEKGGFMSETTNESGPEQQPGSSEERTDVPGTDVGVGIGAGEPNTFEPEEDPDAAPAPER